jgi:hypothetical protein
MGYAESEAGTVAHNYTYVTSLYAYGSGKTFYSCAKVTDSKGYSAYSQKIELTVTNNSLACNASQISSAAYDELVKIVGNQSWVQNHYSFTNYGGIKVVYPQYFPSNISSQYLNATKNLTQASPYDISVEYQFSGPGNLSWQTSMTFVLVNDSAPYCSKIIYWHGIDFVAPYNLSGLITPEQAITIARNKGYDVNFSSLSLIQGADNASVDFLVPGYYSNYSSTFGIQVNAENGTLTLLPIPQPGAVSINSNSGNIFTQIINSIMQWFENLIKGL